MDLAVSDRRIDPIADQIDITIRVGRVADSELIAVRLGEVRRVIAASPYYLARHGTPRTATELLKHNCLLLSGFLRLAQWPMFDGDSRGMMSPRGNITSDNAEVLLALGMTPDPAGP